MITMTFSLKLFAISDQALVQQIKEDRKTQVTKITKAREIEKIRVALGKALENYDYLITERDDRHNPNISDARQVHTSGTCPMGLKVDEAMFLYNEVIASYSCVFLVTFNNKRGPGACTEYIIHTSLADDQFSGLFARYCR